MPSNFYKVIDVPLGACAVYIYIFIQSRIILLMSSFVSDIHADV